MENTNLIQLSGKLLQEPNIFKNCVMFSMAHLKEDKVLFFIPVKCFSDTYETAKLLKKFNNVKVSGYLVEEEYNEKKRIKVVATELIIE